MTPTSAFDFQPLYRAIHDLRNHGEGQALIQTLKAVQHLAQQPFDLLQLGIEMNNAGAWNEAWELLQMGLKSDQIQGWNRMLAHIESGISLFSMGRYEEGRQQTMEGRSDVHHTLVGILGSDQHPEFENIKQKFWQGQPLRGQSILLFIEGGAGDLFMHTRYLNALLADGPSRVDLAIGMALSPVFSTHPKVEWGASFEDHHKADWVSTTFELFFHYQKHVQQASTPVVTDWFALPKALAPEAQAMIDRAQGLKVGLITSSTTRVRHEPFRSVSEGALRPMLEWGRDQPVTWFSLNRGGATPFSTETLQTYQICDMESHLCDFADSAAIMRQLDLVISIDTGPAHLSASLGRPTWLLLSANCDWRWLEHSHHTPWYPSMLLFRQSKLGDWSRPLSEVMIRLQKEMGPRSHPLGPA